MKCQNCGKNEATFYYKSNINGRVMESHLCPECARQLGLVQDMRRPMMSSFWDDDDFFTRPFRMLEPLLGGFGSRLLNHFALRVAQSIIPCLVGTNLRRGILIVQSSNAINNVEEAQVVQIHKRIVRTINRTLLHRGERLACSYGRGQRTAKTIEANQRCLLRHTHLQALHLINRINNDALCAH